MIAGRFFLFPTPRAETSGDVLQDTNPAMIDMPLVRFL